MRSLHDCLHAKYPMYPEEDGSITCLMEHKLGSAHIRQIERNAPLIYFVCWDCPDFVSMDGEVDEEFLDELRREVRNE